MTITWLRITTILLSFRELIKKESGIHLADSRKRSERARFIRENGIAFRYKSPNIRKKEKETYLSPSYTHTQAAVQKRLSAVASFSALRFENRIFLCCDPRTPWEKATLLSPPRKGPTEEVSACLRRKRKEMVREKDQNDKERLRDRRRRERQESGPPSLRMTPSPRMLLPSSEASNAILERTHHSAFRLHQRRLCPPWTWIRRRGNFREDESQEDPPPKRRGKSHLVEPSSITRPTALDGFEFSPRFTIVCVTRSTLIQGYWTCPRREEPTSVRACDGHLFLLSLFLPLVSEKLLGKVISWGN